MPSSLKTSTQSSLQKSPQNSQVSSAHNDNKTKNVIPQMSASQQFELFGVKSPEAIFQSDLNQQDFGYALASSINLFPDPPYEINKEAGPAGQKPFLLQPEFMKKFDLSTLFFLFYYGKTQNHRYYAANELKNRNWKFYTEMNTYCWLHRVGEPIEKTPDYEVGKFDYFSPNNEKWEIQTRNQFKFLYENIID